MLELNNILGDNHWFQEFFKELTQHSSRDIQFPLFPLCGCFVKVIKLQILMWRDQGGLIYEIRYGCSRDMKIRLTEEIIENYVYIFHALHL